MVHLNSTNQKNVSKATKMVDTLDIDTGSTTHTSSTGIGGYSADCDGGVGGCEAIITTTSPLYHWGIAHTLYGHCTIGIEIYTIAIICGLNIVLYKNSY